MVTKFCIVLVVDDILVLFKAQGHRSKVKVTMLKNAIFTFTRKKSLKSQKVTPVMPWKKIRNTVGGWGSKNAFVERIVKPECKNGPPLIQV